MTSALRETLCRVALSATDKTLSIQFATEVEERFFLLSAAFVATCFARSLLVVRCVTQRNDSDNLSRRFREDCGTSCVTDYTVTGLGHEHKCLPG